MATERGRGQLTLTDINDVLAQATPPVNPTDGALWYNTTEKQLYVYQGGRWMLSNNVIVGGRNYYSKKTDIFKLTNNPTIVKNPATAPNGFRITGQQNIVGSVRVPSVITENGWWTISFWGMANGTSTLNMDICDGATANFTLTTSWQKFSFSGLVSNFGAPYDFVDINNIGWINYDIKDFKVEKGNIPTDWSPAPEDIDDRFGEVEKTLNNMADDSIIDYTERQIIKDKLTDILGYVLADTATALPTSTVNDAGTNGKGSYYNGRKNALSAGYPTTSAPYINLKTKYDALKTYLETYTTKPWDVSTANKASYTSVDKSVFRTRWLDYYTAELDLANAVIEWLKKVADDISIGGTNYASNGHFEYDITKSLWSSAYLGQLREVVDISTETPPFKKALHVKNTSNASAGILAPTLWSGVSAQAMVDKEITITYWLKYSGITAGANSYQAGRFGELVIEGQKSDGAKVYRYPRIHSDGNPTETLYITGTNTTWVKYSATHKLSLPSGAVKLTSIQFKHSLEQCVGEFWTTGLQIEVGNRASDWSENPEDLRQRFTNVEQAITANSIISTISTTPAWQSKADYDTISNSNTNQLLHKTRFTDNPTEKWAFSTPWAVDNTKYFEGFGTAKIDVSGKTSDSWVALYSEFIEASAGETFTGSGYVMTDSLSADVEGRKYYLEIEFFNSSNSRIVASGQILTNTVVNTWERFSKTAIAPANTVKARLRFHPTRNGRFWVAKPMLVRSPVLTAYSEHPDELATELQSKISQTADKVAIVVKADNSIDGSSIASSIVATPSAISLVSTNISFTGRVTFQSLASDLAPSFETNGRVKAGNLSGTVPDANIASSANWNASKANVDNIFSDMKVTPLEKNTLKNESEKIKKEYAQKKIQADIAGVDATNYINAYSAIYNITPKMDAEVLASMTTTYTFGSASLRDNFRNQMIEYYNQVAILNKAITDNTTDIGLAMTGKMLYTDPLFRDGNNNLQVYNNTANSTDVQIIRQTLPATPAENLPPSGSPNILEIKISGTSTNPSMGGFTFLLGSKANAVFYVRFIAKIPSGYNLSFASNAIGTTGNATRWLTSNLGTGKWEEYMYKITCGSVPPFSSTAFFYLSPNAGVTPAFPMSWYLDSATVYEHSSTDYSVYDSAKMISDMVSDGKLSPTEKIQLRKEWGLVVAEYVTTKGIAQNYSVSTTNYDSAYNTLNAQVPSLISNVTVTSDAPSNLRTNFENYYKRRAELSSAVTDKTYSMQNTVGAMNNNILLDQWTGSLPTGTVSHGTASYIKKETSIVRDGLASVRFNGMGTSESGLNLNAGFIKSNISNAKYVTIELSFYLVSGTTQGAGVLLDWGGMSNTAPLTNRVSVTLESMTEESIVAGRWYNAKATIRRPHDTVSGYTGMASYLMANYSSLGALTAKDIIVNRYVLQEASAEEIKSYKGDIIITDMASDSKITPQEKIQLKKEWTSIQKEYDPILRVASNGGMSNDTVYLDYVGGYDNLSKNVTPVLSNMTTTTTVTSAFRTAFDYYYYTKNAIKESFDRKSYDKANNADNLVGTWKAPNKVTIDGAKIEASTIISSTVLSIANGSSTKITGGQIVSDGSFTRTFDGSNVATYTSRFESYNGAVKIGISSKKTGTTERVASGGRSITYTDKAMTTQREIHSGSGEKNGARFIDFFADETYTSDVVGLGMHIYSAQKMQIETQNDLEIYAKNTIYLDSTGTSSVYARKSFQLESIGHVTLRSTQGYIFLQPEYDNLGNNSFSLQVIDGSTSADTDGVILYGSQVNGYASGIRFSKQVSDPTIYLTDGSTARGKGNLEANRINAYEFNGTIVREGGSRVVTNDRMASGYAVVSGTSTDTPTSVIVKFGQTFSSAPAVVAVANTSVPGVTVKGVGVTDVTTTQFKLWVSRSNSTDTGVQWIAYKG